MSMGARYCARCGAAAASVDRYCRECGGPLGDPALDGPPGADPDVPPGRVPAGTADLHVGELVAAGWRATCEHFWLLVGMFLLVVLLQYVPQLIIRTRVTDATVRALLNFIFTWLVSAVVSVAWIRVSLNLADGQPVTWRDLFPSSPLVLNYLVASILFGLIVTGGLLLLIVPGVIWGLKFYFYAYFIVDKDSNVLDALRASARATSGVKWDLFRLALASIGIVLLGVLALFVGVLVAAPVVQMAWAFAYRTLEPRPQARQQPRPVPAT